MENLSNFFEECEDIQQSEKSVNEEKKSTGKKSTGKKSTGKKSTGKKSTGKKSTGKKKELTEEEKKEKELKALIQKDLGTRSRRWNIILYPDCAAHMDILYYLTGDNPEGIQGFYIFHSGEPKTDDDNHIVLGEDGKPEIKKDHYHVTISYDNPRTKRAVIKAFSHQIDGALIQKTQDINSTYNYMLHKTYDCFVVGKKVYQHKDIKPLGNGSLALLNQVAGLETETTNIVKDIISIGECEENPLELVKNFVDCPEHLKFIVKNPYFVRTFLMKSVEKNYKKKS